MGLKSRLLKLTQAQSETQRFSFEKEGREAKVQEVCSSLLIQGLHLQVRYRRT